MINLREHKDLIFNIKRKVNSLDNSLFNHNITDNFPITSNTISIVMTCSNRSAQTYFTLKTIKQSNFKNIQVIIVDDSNEDPINVEILKEFPFYIDLISIKKENKDWHNPLVNYNLGFKFIKGTKVIIQNAEVCHIGDILDFVSKNVEDNNYYVFDVKACNSFNSNEIIYDLPLDNLNNTDIYLKEELFSMWYQNKNLNRNLHFLTAVTKNTFNIISEFSYDYTMGTWYDDDDFVLKINSKNINICNIFNDEYNLGGIHLFHISSGEKWDYGKPSNLDLFTNKEKILKEKNEYIDVTLDYNKFEEQFEKLQK